MPGPYFRLSILDGELLALTRSTHATPIFTLTDSASRSEVSALDRAGPLEMQTHEKCRPRRISSLEYALTKNVPATPLERTLTKSLDLKSPGMNTYKKEGGGNSTPQQKNLIPAGRKTRTGAVAQASYRSSWPQTKSGPAQEKDAT